MYISLLLPVLVSPPSLGSPPPRPCASASAPCPFFSVRSLPVRLSRSLPLLLLGLSPFVGSRPIVGTTQFRLKKTIQAISFLSLAVPLELLQISADLLPFLIGSGATGKAPFDPDINDGIFATTRPFIGGNDAAISADHPHDGRTAIGPDEVA